MARTADPFVDSCYHLTGESIEGTACAGTACFVARHRNADRYASAAKNPCKVSCLGRCFEAPAIQLGEGRPEIVQPEGAAIILERMASGPCRTASAYGGFPALEKARSAGPAAILAELATSQLRGRGGAGFPVTRKWAAVEAQPPGQKYIVANADEGDAGSYIDRMIMEDDPFALFEGMAIAGSVCGASIGVIYLRAEYAEAKRILNAALLDARSAGLLGDAFEIELCVGHGSYVCGEETALLNSIEGRTPFVRARPPYPFQSGLYGRPTAVNNVETLAAVPWIVRHGGAAYAAIGVGESRGTKAISLNSLFRRPGLFEVEFGVSVRHIVERLGGGLAFGELQGVMIGGPLAGVVPPSLLDTPFTFEDLAAIDASVGHGGIIAIDERTSIRSLIHHVFEFGAYESCGKCTPCRVGARDIERWFGVDAPISEPEFMRTLTALREASLCGHGTGLAAFVDSILRHYPEEVRACLASS